MYFTGFYNLVFCDTVIETDYFIYNEEKKQKYLIKKIFKKYKKLLKEHYIDSVQINIFNIDFYEKNNNYNDILETLDEKLENIRYGKKEVFKTFDFTDLKNILDTL